MRRQHPMHWSPRADRLRVRARPKAGRRRKRPRAAFPPVDWPAASRRKRGAFTLVELLVVVSIIALLVAILVPSLRRAMVLVRRMRCATNMNGITKAMVLYAADFETYPSVPLNGAGWGVEVGTNRDVDPGGGAPRDRNPTSGLYMLVRAHLCSSEIFVCPATRETAENEPDDHWDFASGQAVSYAVMNPYGAGAWFVEPAGSVPILADGNPYFDPDTGLRNDEAIVNLAGAAPADAAKGNSPNHDREGQNVSLVGGSTTWRKRADVGVGRDNIYTRADAADGTDRLGSIPAPGADGAAGGQGPAGPWDSYLVP